MLELADEAFLQRSNALLIGLLLVFPDVLNAEPDGEEYEDALDAVRSCPGYAVRLEDED